MICTNLQAVKEQRYYVHRSFLTEIIEKYEMIAYKTTGSKTYVLSYRSLREDYIRFKNMTDEEFIDNALDILHFCCIVGYMKEIPSDTLLIDDGIIHELVHLLVETTKSDAIYDLPKIRQIFNKVMELA
jgi:hypothetical protein